MKNIGIFVEWYDYILYGFFAPIIAHQFFSVTDHYTVLMAAYASFAAGYIARPFGGIVFGHLGDQYRRGRSIQLSLLLMAMATFAIGVLPTYRVIGVYSPILLLSLRLVQGFSAGGQSTGSYVRSYEQGRRKGRAVAHSWLMLTAGILFGLSVCWVMMSWFPKHVVHGAWRIPFLLGLPLALLSLLVKQKDAHNEPDKCVPFLTLLKTYKRQMFIGAIILGLPSVAYYQLLIFGISFLSWHGKLAITSAMLLSGMGLLAGVVVAPWIGRLTQYYRTETLMKASGIGLVVFIVPGFYLLTLGHFVLSVMVILLLVFLKDLFAIPAILHCLPLFSSSVRYSGFALIWNVANGVFGGTAPLISVWLIHHTRWAIAPSIYLAGFAAVSLVLTHLKQANTTAVSVQNAKVK